jgi:phosphoglycolate phosphatase
LVAAIQRLQCQPGSIVYVGDSVVDAEVAKRADVPFIVVLSGVTPRDHFQSYEPIGVIESLSELPRLLF